MKYIDMDITTVGSGCILNGVNCQDRMGSGVAKAIYQKWPIVKECYHAIGKSNMHLGLVDIMEVDQGIFVANCWTQEYYGYDGKKYANADAISKCLDQIGRIGFEEIYSPLIGCGLGGLDWDTEVQPVFESFENKYSGSEVIICIHK